MKVVYNIAELRNRLHLSDRYVANFLGLSIEDYLLLENGERNPSTQEVMHLQLLFGKRIAPKSNLTHDEEEIEKLQLWNKNMTAAVTKFI